MDKLLKHIRFVEEYDLQTLFTIAAVLALTCYFLNLSLKKLFIVEIKPVDTSQMGEIKILFEEDDYDELIQSLFNYAVDVVREKSASGSIKMTT